MIITISIEYPQQTSDWLAPLMLRYVSHRSIKSWENRQWTGKETEQETTHMEHRNSFRKQCSYLIETRLSPMQNPPWYSKISLPRTFLYELFLYHINQIIWKLLFTLLYQLLNSKIDPFTVGATKPIPYR